MGWNYRVIEFEEHEALHEVYYDDDGNPNGYTEDPATFAGEHGELDLHWVADRLRSAAEKPKLVVRGGKFVP